MGKRSPVEGRVPRQAGESGRRKISEIIDDETMPWAVVALCAWFAAIVDLAWYLAGWAPQPLLVGALAAALSAVAGAKIVMARKELRDRRLGVDGEVVVAAMLERLRAHGYEVFNDIEGDGFNIDHVVVGPGGVFVIETKTISKRDGENKVEFDGHQVRINGALPDRDPVAQVRRNAEDIRRIIRDRAGMDVTPRTIVVFPGWYVESKGNAWNSGVWVMNEKTMVKYLTRQWPELENPDLRRIAAVLRGLAKHKDTP